MYALPTKKVFSTSTRPAVYGRNHKRLRRRPIARSSSTDRRAASAAGASCLHARVIVTRHSDDPTHDGRVPMHTVRPVPPRNGTSMECDLPTDQVHTEARHLVALHIFFVVSRRPRRGILRRLARRAERGGRSAEGGARRAEGGGRRAEGGGRRADHKPKPEPIGQATEPSSYFCGRVVKDVVIRAACTP